METHALSVPQLPNKWCLCVNIITGASWNFQRHVFIM